jgi:DNA-binding response OmpR family regulator
VLRLKIVAVVNNEKHIADWVRMNLEAEGIRAHVYYRGIDALTALIEEPADLIMLSCR